MTFIYVPWGIDPTQRWWLNFSIISVSTTSAKDWYLVLGQERGVVIFDDTEKVWKDHKENLILLGSYNYFKERRNKKNNILQKSVSENKLNGALVNVLRVLKTVNRLFFENPGNLFSGDIRFPWGKFRGRFLQDVHWSSSGMLMIRNLNFHYSNGGLPSWVLHARMCTICQWHVVSVSARPGTEDCWSTEQFNSFFGASTVDLCCLLSVKQTSWEGYFLL